MLNIDSRYSCVMARGGGRGGAQNRVFYSLCNGTGGGAQNRVFYSSYFGGGGEGAQNRVFYSLCNGTGGGGAQNRVFYSSYFGGGGAQNRVFYSSYFLKLNSLVQSTTHLFVNFSLCSMFTMYELHRRCHVGRSGSFTLGTRRKAPKQKRVL